MNTPAVRRHNAALLSSAYLPPVQWFAKLAEYPKVYVEQYDHYAKQTYRNRCLIATQAGVQALTVPVALREQKTYMRDVEISSHGSWQHQHWQSLVSAYQNSPFFEFYADDFRPIYEQPPRLLIDMNQRLTALVCQLIGLECEIRLTAEYADPADLCADDFRTAINPKHPAADPRFTPAEYYQVFAARGGFLPNLSIVDLLFNEGPESILTLMKCFPAPRVE